MQSESRTIYTHTYIFMQRRDKINITLFSVPLQERSGHSGVLGGLLGKAFKKNMVKKEKNAIVDP